MQCILVALNEKAGSHRKLTHFNGLFRIYKQAITVYYGLFVDYCGLLWTNSDYCGFQTVKPMFKQVAQDKAITTKKPVPLFPVDPGHLTGSKADYDACEFDQCCAFLCTFRIHRAAYEL